MFSILSLGFYVFKDRKSKRTRCNSLYTRSTFVSACRARPSSPMSYSNSKANSTTKHRVQVLATLCSCFTVPVASRSRNATNSRRSWNSKKNIQNIPSSGDYTTVKLFLLLLMPAYACRPNSGQWFTLFFVHTQKVLALQVGPGRAWTCVVPKVLKICSQLRFVLNFKVPEAVRRREPQVRNAVDNR